MATPKSVAIGRRTKLDALPELVRVEEFASWAGISRGLAYEAVRRGDLRGVRLGRLLFVPKAAIAEWIGNAGELTKQED